MKTKTSKPPVEQLKSDRVNVLNSAFDEIIETIDAYMKISPIVFFELALALAVSRLTRTFFRTSESPQRR